MKITFVEPPPITKKTPERLAGCSYELYHFPDLANLYLLSYIHRCGFEVNYIDAVMEKWDRDKFCDRLREDMADVYIIHSVILSKATDIEAIKWIRSITSKAMILFHGPEPTRVAQEYLIDSKIVVFRGEPEKNIITFLEKGVIEGGSYLKDDKICEEPPSSQILIDFDELPVPMRTYGILSKYKNKYFNPKFQKKPFTVMMASRGCAFNCLFCVPNSISFARQLEYLRYFNKKPSPSIGSANRIIAEFRQIKEEGFGSVLVIDDQFLWGKERTLAICNGIKELGIEWGCLSRADFLTDEEVIKSLSEAGCKSIDIGAESLCQRTLDYARKDMNLETIYKAIDLLQRYNITPKINIVLGLSPFETKQELKKTIAKLKQMKGTNVMFSIATPFKGTEFYSHCQSHGYLIDESDDIDPLHKAIISYPELNNNTLEQFQRYAYKAYYLRPQYILKRIASYTNFQCFVNDIKIAIELLRKKK